MNSWIKDYRKDKWNNDAIERGFIDWFNNFTSTDWFAEYYGLPKIEAMRILDHGKRLNNFRNKTK